MSSPESVPIAAPVDELRNSEKASLFGASTVTFDKAAYVDGYAWINAVKFDRLGMPAIASANDWLCAFEKMLTGRLTASQARKSLMRGTELCSELILLLDQALQVSL